MFRPPLFYPGIVGGGGDGGDGPNSMLPPPPLPLWPHYPPRTYVFVSDYSATAAAGAGRFIPLPPFLPHSSPPLEHEMEKKKAAAAAAAVATMTIIDEDKSVVVVAAAAVATPDAEDKRGVGASMQSIGIEQVDAAAAASIRSIGIDGAPPPPGSEAKPSNFNILSSLSRHALVAWRGGGQEVGGAEGGGGEKVISTMEHSQPLGVYNQVGIGHCQGHKVEEEEETKKKDKVVDDDDGVCRLHPLLPPPPPPPPPPAPAHHLPGRRRQPADQSPPPRPPQPPKPLPRRRRQQQQQQSWGKTNLRPGTLVRIECGRGRGEYGRIVRGGNGYYGVQLISASHSHPSNTKTSSSNVFFMKRGLDLRVLEEEAQREHDCVPLSSYLYSSCSSNAFVTPAPQPVTTTAVGPPPPPPPAASGDGRGGIGVQGCGEESSRPGPETYSTALAPPPPTTITLLPSPPLPTLNLKTAVTAPAAPAPPACADPAAAPASNNKHDYAPPDMVKRKKSRTKPIGNAEALMNAKIGEGGGEWPAKKKRRRTPYPLDHHDLFLEHEAEEEIRKKYSYHKRSVIIVSPPYKGQIGIITRSGHGFYCVEIPGRGHVMKRAAEIQLIRSKMPTPPRRARAPASALPTASSSSSSVEETQGICEAARILVALRYSSRIPGGNKKQEVAALRRRLHKRRRRVEEDDAAPPPPP